MSTRPLQLSPQLLQQLCSANVHPSTLIDTFSDLEVSAQLDTVEPQLLCTYYCAYLLALFADNDLNEARFLMTRTPVSLHSDPAIINAASLLKALYSCSYPAIYSHLAAPTWDPVLTGLRDRFAEIFRRRTCSLLSSAYTSISPESVSYYLGIEASPASSAQPWFVQGGWKTDGAGMFIPPSPSSREGMTRKKDNDTRISRLTALVTHLTEG